MFQIPQALSVGSILDQKATITSNAAGVGKVNQILKRFVQANYFLPRDYEL